MGVRRFVKNGVLGLAKAAVKRPFEMLKGNAGTRSAAPDPDLSPEALKAAWAALPTALDAQGHRAVSQASQVQPGKAGQFEVFGSTVAVFRVDGHLYAVDNTCLHEDGPLGEGTLEGLSVTCPYHDWRYDLRNGKCLTEPGRALACHPVSEHDGFIWVGPPKGSSSGDRGGEHDDGLKSR